MLSVLTRSFHRMGIVGSSPTAETLRQSVERIAASTSHVLLVGEPGVGKRFVADQIHRATSKTQGTFAEVHPRTTEEEIKAILFEENRKRTEGMIGKRLPSLGKHSTVLVRNIHEFSIIGQTRIARFLIQNSPESAHKRTDARVILAVPIPWLSLRKERLIIDSVDVFVQRFEHLVIPPLREHVEDIPELVRAFVETILRNERESPSISDADLNRLKTHPWRENIRELRFLIEEALAISPGTELKLPADFLDEMSTMKEMLGRIISGKKVDIEPTLDALDKSLLRRALIRTGFDKTKAAHMLGISDIGLRYRLKKHQIHLPKTFPGRIRHKTNGNGS